MQSSETSPKDSLFNRLGGSKGIAALVDDVVSAHTENKTIQSRFLPYLKEPERLAVIKEHTCQFFSAGSGGPADYAGRSMPEAHAGMNVSTAEYMAAVDDIVLTLRKHEMDEPTQKDVLWILYSLMPTIVHQ